MAMGIRQSIELYHEITTFYNKESWILDNRRFEEWLELLTEDITYRMPIRVTKERRDGSDINDKMTYFEETKKTLDTRVKRLNTKTAWAEDPPPRTRRFITNIVIEKSIDDNEVQVSSNYLVTRSRAEDINFELFVGEKQDILRKENGTWKIARRTIIPDQATLNLQNLSMIL